MLTLNYLKKRQKRGKGAPRMVAFRRIFAYAKFPIVNLFANDSIHIERDPYDALASCQPQLFQQYLHWVLDRGGDQRMNGLITNWNYIRILYVKFVRPGLEYVRSLSLAQSHELHHCWAGERGQYFCRVPCFDHVSSHGTVRKELIDSNVLQRYDVATFALIAEDSLTTMPNKVPPDSKAPGVAAL